MLPLCGFLGSISAVQNSTDQGLQSSPRSKEPKSSDDAADGALLLPACFLTWHYSALVQPKGSLGASTGVSYVMLSSLEDLP